MNRMIFRNSGKKFWRYNFNMVEIMLAVIVIALGIAGTFVLFPVGLNATREAAAENSISDIAEYVTAYARAECMLSAIKNTADEAFDNDKLNDIFGDDSDKNENENKNKIVDPVSVDNPSDGDWDIPSSHEDRCKKTSEALLLKHKSKKGVYLVRQMTGLGDRRYVEFAAIARVYLDRKDSSDSGFGEEYFCNIKASPDDPYTKYDSMPFESGKAPLPKFLIPAVLELSWPANVPEADREKRYFRFEIFNDRYKQKPAQEV